MEQKNLHFFVRKWCKKGSGGVRVGSGEVRVGLEGLGCGWLG